VRPRGIQAIAVRRACYTDGVSERRASRETIRKHMTLAMAAAVTPVPGADIAVVSAVQFALVRRLALDADVTWDVMRGRAVVVAVAGASLARLGASAIKALPGAGWIAGSAAQAVLSGASTWAVGTVFREHFRSQGTLDDVDLSEMRARYREALARGRAVARAMRRTLREDPAVDEETARLSRLQGLRRTGALTEEEFERLVAMGDPSDESVS
jgi:uncharacterized protein (DUF697 family)